MRSFDYRSLPQELLSPRIMNLVSEIHEYRGKQDLYIAQKPEVLATLCDVAKIQSTGSSNTIEGIRTTDARLRDLMNENVAPRNRDEEEILGYRDVLTIIHESYDAIPVTPNYILQLHKILYAHGRLSFGGRWKDSNNAIVEIDANGNRHVRFKPTPAIAVPNAMDEICQAYNDAIAAGEIDPLLLTALFTLDFVCIHPFNDGNGRMSRLLTLLLLYRSGYLVGKYVSIEREIERSKELYYDALQACSPGWNEGTNATLPFVYYLLWCIANAYEKFANRAEGLMLARRSKSQRVEDTVRQHLGNISKAQILDANPDISMATVEKALAQMLSQGKIAKVGAARATKYHWVG